MRLLAIVLACLASVALPFGSHSFAQTDEVTIHITVFTRDSFSVSQGKNCMPDVPESNPRLRMISADDSSIEVISLKRSVPVADDNPYVPGERGCVESKKTTFEEDDFYVFQLNDRELFTASWSYLQDRSEMIIVLDENTVIAPEMELLELPESVATPQSTPATPAATQVPAGDQGDGTFLLRGYLRLFDDDAIVSGNECYGSSGYDDIGTGTQVIARDGENNVLGVGVLVSTGEAKRGDGCSFVFEIEVEESRFYQIEMSHRGQMVFTFEDLEEADWTVRLSIG